MREGRENALKVALENAIRGSDWPKIEVAKIERLEALFPPRCLGTGESVEDHLRYAGKVELIAMMRAASTVPIPPNVQLTPAEEEALQDDMATAEAETKLFGPKSP